jgi:hypothetical protein
MHFYVVNRDVFYNMSMWIIIEMPHSLKGLTADVSSHPVPSSVYFVQGILGLSRLAIQFFFKDDLHIEPAEVCDVM